MENKAKVLYLAEGTGVNWGDFKTISEFGPGDFRILELVVGDFRLGDFRISKLIVGGFILFELIFIVGEYPGDRISWTQVLNCDCGKGKVSSV